MPRGDIIFGLYTSIINDPVFLAKKFFRLPGEVIPGILIKKV